ncbi:sensor histidine kinase [Luteimonas sp. BDR2-5]|uniref:ATP-binding protein n=1 Tax=Proluteimonas luteida TaxID=2878685 RepID=UPI001E3FFE81|nr:ATP-binding protein [Luteimonas sp. BDR2-5]MCD9027641.1 sensor histidine kinase [Luteimonas sp. BDR2-5]
MQSPATTLVRTLYTLRWVAVGAQSVTILLAGHGLGLALPAWPLWAGVALLAGFNLLVGLRLRSSRDAAPAEAFAHGLVDTAVLAWLVAWTGGIANPFASLFLLPIALTALALPVQWAVATALACVAGYLLAVAFGQPLPHGHDDSLDLHFVGMAVNFLVSVALVVYFLTRLVAARDQREQELSALRERFARNEGILALATHAASVAHELNTPLGTMTLLLDDLDPQARPDDAAADVATLRRLVDICRDRVRSLADPADPAAPTTVDLGRVLEHWQLVRPAVSLQRSGNVDGDRRIDRSLGHLLLALLNNAADASEGNGRSRVDLDLQTRNGMLIGEIRDYGPAFDGEASFLPVLFRSTKPDGLGVGLALSHAAVEQLGGDLHIEDAEGGGARVRFRVPMTPDAPTGAPRR